MLSPRSRGKGKRRFPGRDGGRRKQKPVAWRKRATHAVDDRSELPGQLVELSYVCSFDQSAAQAIYSFDQALAHTGIRYHAELHGGRYWPVFTLRVPADSVATVRSIITRLQQR